MLCIKRNLRLEYFLKKHGDKSFGLFMVISIVPLMMYETVLNSSFVWAFKYLSVPIVIICFYVYFKRIPNLRRESGELKGITLTTVVAAMLLLMSGGFVLGFNNFIGPQSDFQLSGSVVKLDTYESTKAGTSYYVFIKTIDTGKTLKLDVSKKNYTALKVGDFYSEPWKKGSLGLLYKRK